MNIKGISLISRLLQFALCGMLLISGSMSRAADNLPVGLLNFDVFVNGKQVSISWKTAAETNNDYFSIEKSTDGESWELVEIVKGAGNSPTILDYNTIDREPLTGRSFYRLKQTDYDGAFTYSKTQEIHYDDSNNISVEVFPNPAIEHIYITGSPYELQHIELINRYNQDLTQFIEIITNNETKLTLNLTNVSAGKYLLKTKTTEHELFIL